MSSPGRHVPFQCPQCGRFFKKNIINHWRQSNCGPIPGRGFLQVCVSAEAVSSEVACVQEVARCPPAPSHHYHTREAQRAEEEVCEESSLQGEELSSLGSTAPEDHALLDHPTEGIDGTFDDNADPTQWSLHLHDPNDVALQCVEHPWDDSWLTHDNDSSGESGGISINNSDPHPDQSSLESVSETSSHAGPIGPALPLYDPPSAGLHVNPPGTATAIADASSDSSGPTSDVSGSHDPTLLGTVIEYPVDHPSYTSANIFTSMDRSMMRLYDYCEFSGCSHQFLDGLLEIIGDEILHNDFKPHLAPKRKSFVKGIRKRFGASCGKPICVNVPLVNDKHDPYKVKIPREVTRGSRDLVQVIKFEIVKQVLDLADDRYIFGNLDNLVVNRDKPFGPYQTPSGTLDEVYDGSWYRDTCQRMKIDWEKEFLLGMMLYADKTGTDVYQRYGLEPFLFTFPIIRRALCNQTRSWRCAGYIPDLELKSSATKQVLRNKKKGKGASQINYHHCLSVIVQALVEADREGIYTWLHLGGQVKYVRLRIPIAFIIGDGKSGDQLCQRYAGYTGMSRLSRTCKVSYRDADKPLHVCQFITAKEIDTLIETATSTPEDLLPEDDQQVPIQVKLAKAEIKKAHNKLMDLCAHVVINAFQGANFGGDKRGIYGATPTDLMHAFQLGWLRYIVKLALDPLSPTNKKRLDDLVDKLFGNLRSSEKDTYPRVNFTHGFTNLTMITSDEWVGMLFMLLLVLQTEEGVEIMQNVFTGEEDIDLDCENLFNEFGNEDIRHLEKLGDATAENPEEPSLESDEEEASLSSDDPSNVDDDLDDDKTVGQFQCSIGDFVHLAEALLSFHAWYKLGSPYDWSRVGEGISEQAVLLGVRKMMALVRIYVPRSKGNGWKLQKFHDLLHLASDMARFGSPLNFDAGPGESSLRFWAKFLSGTAQKRGYKTFLQQVASRCYEFHYMGKARRCMGVVGYLDGMLPSCSHKIPHISPDNTPRFPVVHWNQTAVKSHHYAGILIPAATLRGSSFTLSKQPTSGVLTVSWSGDASQRKGHLDLHPLILHYFSLGPTDSEDEPIDWRNMVGYTEMLLPWPPSLPTGHLAFRAHPNYNADGYWYDWVIVHYHPSLNSGFKSSFDEDLPALQPTYEPSEVPAKLLCFVSIDNNSAPKALVHACDFRTHNNDDTTMCEHWTLEYQRTNKRKEAVMEGKSKPVVHTYYKAIVRCIDVDSIVDQVFVVEENPGVAKGFWCPGTQIGSLDKRKAVVLVRKRPSWAKNFI